MTHEARRKPTDEADGEWATGRPFRRRPRPDRAGRGTASPTSPRRRPRTPRRRAARGLEYEIVEYSFGSRPSGSSFPSTLPPCSGPRPRGPGPGAVRFGDGKGSLLWLPRAAQRRTGPYKGESGSTPGGARRGARARGAHDVEDGHREPAIRRREGRRERRPEQARDERASVRLALVHGQDREGARPTRDTRHPMSGRTLR